MKHSDSLPPEFALPEGEFSVDYRDHNGKIVLGMNDWSFVTAWSTGGAGVIHVMNDPPGIKGVAVAGGISKISEVTSVIFASANFTSRHRTPRTGQVVLFENTHGYAAAVELLSITITPEGETGTELKARYKILTNKNRDFSDPQDQAFENISALAANALQSLSALQPDAPIEYKAIGMGHNSPPEDCALDYSEHAELTGTITNLATEAKRHTIATATLDKATEQISTSIAKITKWLVARAKQIEEGFFRQMGSSLAIALTGLSAWAIFTGKLESLTSAISLILRQ
jgi:DNA transposition AAA+ family ATPase